jgi:2-oxoglutarate ferredoxin oxidoreductase subunit delta
MPKIEINREKCKGCLLCVSVCPKGSIKQDKKLNARGVKPVEFTEGASCIGCAMCAVICPDCAIEVFKEE